MTQSVDQEQIQRLAKHLAHLGREKVEQLQLVAQEALSLLDSSEPMLPQGQTDTYPWEQTEPVSDGTRAVYLATVEDYATGEGLTVYFAAVLARSEDEARRSLSRLWSRNLAHLATLARGADGSVPYARLFLSAELWTSLQHIQVGEERPAAFSYQARYHMNLS